MICPVPGAICSGKACGLTALDSDGWNQGPWSGLRIPWLEVYIDKFINLYKIESNRDERYSDEG